MRWSEVARDALSPVVFPDVVGLVLAPDASVPEPLVVPLVDPLDVPLVVPLVASFEVPLGAAFDVPLGAAFDVPLPDVPLGALEPPVEPPLVDGRFISTSPPEVPVVVPLGEVLPVLGTQFAALVVAFACAPDAVPDMAREVVLAPAVVPLAVLLPAADVSRVDGVVPVPFAPLVVFSPVKRWSGLVAVLLAESARAAPVVPVAAPAAPPAAPEVDIDPAPIVVPDE
jgi:hypothetical protein